MWRAPKWQSSKHIWVWVIFWCFLALGHTWLAHMMELFTRIPKLVVTQKWWSKIDEFYPEQGRIKLNFSKCDYMVSVPCSQSKAVRRSKENSCICFVLRTHQCICFPLLTCVSKSCRHSRRNWNLLNPPHLTAPDSPSNTNIGKTRIWGSSNCFQSGTLANHM